MHCKLQHFDFHNRRPVHRAVGLLWQPSIIVATCVKHLCVHFLTENKLMMMIITGVQCTLLYGHIPLRRSAQDLVAGRRACRSNVIWVLVVVNICASLQWSSQALKSGSAQRAWRTEVPQRGPGAEPRWCLEAKSPEARCIYKQFAAVKCFTTQVYCRVRPPSPPIPQKIFGSHARIP